MLVGDGLSPAESCRCNTLPSFCFAVLSIWRTLPHAQKKNLERHPVEMVDLYGSGRSQADKLRKLLRQNGIEVDDRDRSWSGCAVAPKDHSPRDLHIITSTWDILGYLGTYSTYRYI